MQNTTPNTSSYPTTVPMVLYRFGFNGQEKDNEVYGDGNAYDFGARVYDPRVGRWMACDPQSSKYPSLSPYNFVGNSPIRAIDPNGEDIYILFATSGNERGDDMISASADTRKRNIENSKSFDPAVDKVVVIEVQDLAQIKDLVNETVTTYSAQYGKTKEVGVFSHGGWQGPTGSVPTSEDAIKSEGQDTKQMELEGWAKIDFNWVDAGASFTMYGCNTGNDLSRDKTQWVGSFARDLSELPNFNNVNVAGQSSSAFPSFSPQVRETNLARTYYPSIGFSVGDTYMVGGTSGEGSSSMWFTSGSYPSAAPMNVYQEGKKIGSGIQSTSASRPVNY